MGLEQVNEGMVRRLGRTKGPPGVRPHATRLRVRRGLPGRDPPRLHGRRRVRAPDAGVVHDFHPLHVALVHVIEKRAVLDTRRIGGAPVQREVNPKGQQNGEVHPKRNL